MMIVQVLMLAFSSSSCKKVREVRIDDDTPDYGVGCLLEAVFREGQNDVCPVPSCYSVSMGDVIIVKRPVIEIGGVIPVNPETPYLVCGMGFHPMSMVELVEYVGLDQRDRALKALKY